MIRLDITYMDSEIVNHTQVDPDNDEVLNDLLDNHARLVMNVVHELVTNIDNLDVLHEKLCTLGIFHLKNEVPKRYLDIMGPIFCNAVRPILLHHDIWSPDVEESWMEIFKILTTIMKKGYEDAQPSPEQLALSPTQECDTESRFLILYYQKF